MFNGLEDEFEDVFKWYIAVKDILIDAETLDPNRKTYYQPFNELRYALDHIMRSYNYDKNGDLNKARAGLKSAKGHIQRTYTDCIDWSLISVLDIYSECLRDIDKNIIVEYFPEFYTSIFPALREMRFTVAEYRKKKSVEDKEHQFDYANLFKNEHYYSKLRDYIDKLNEVYPKIIANKNKQNQQSIEIIKNECDNAISKLNTISNEQARKSIKKSLDKIKSAFDVGSENSCTDYIKKDAIDVIAAKNSEWLDRYFAKENENG